jgi:PAS domain S-box-containing protein
MSLAVLDRPATTASRLAHRADWKAAVRGPLPTTAVVAAAAVVLAIGGIPVADRLLTTSGLALALAATAAGWVTRRSHAALPALAVAVAQTAAVVLLYAGTTSAPLLLLLLGPLGVGASAVISNDRRVRAQSRDIARLQREQAVLLEQVRSRADELDTASRILAARAQTMTSVIDAVTQQSIIGTDRDGTIRVWNPGAEKMLGLLRPDVVRKRSILEFHEADELAAAAESTGSTSPLEALVHAARVEGSDVRDWTYVAADGSPRTVSVAITPRADDRGVHAGWNFVGTDMTEARATERMKDQFVSLISHELRTPLSSILGYLELVMDDEDSPLTDEQRQYLTTVERNAQRLLRLVGDLLFTAQVDSGRFTLQPTAVDLAAVVRAAEETARVAAANAGVEIVVDVPADGLVVPGDAVRLGQACDNLVSNAVKFTPGGGHVRLSLARAWQTADGTIVDDECSGAVPVALLSVADTGMGIPAGEQGELFTRFFRSSTARRNAVPGVGLGLTITKAITTAHGGSLDLVSAEGQGTTFTMTLPVDPAV